MLCSPTGRPGDHTRCNITNSREMILVKHFYKMLCNCKYFTRCFFFKQHNYKCLSLDKVKDKINPRLRRCVRCGLRGLDITPNPALPGTVSKSNYQHPTSTIKTDCCAS